MKLIIQIPCYNEEATLPTTVADLPRELPGIDSIEYLVVDDGSDDQTAEVARACGVHHVVGFPRNRGLARAFQCGINTCLDLGADIIVNTDADNQYHGGDIHLLVEPILARKADIVIGDRQTDNIKEFSPAKRFLQRQGSFIARVMSCTDVSDATSGFRAMSREAALQLNVVSNFSYTLETLIQAGRKHLAVISVPIRTNPKLRESRLFKSIFQFVKRSGATMVRVYTTHEPLKVFLTAALALLILGAIPFVRFLMFFLQGEGSGHTQSLVFGAVFCLGAGIIGTLGILADMITSNRKLIEELLRHQRDHGLK